MIKHITASLVFWISFYIPGMTVELTANSTQITLNDCDVVNVDENMYVGTKRLCYKEQPYGQNQTPQIKYDNTYFIFERLTNENYDFWRSYHDTNNFKSPIMKHENGTRVSIVDGLCAFRKTLDLFSASPNDGYSIWVAYVSRKDPRIMRKILPVKYRPDIPWENSKWPEDKQEEYQAYIDKESAYFRAKYEFEIKENDIEMVVTVFADAISPITSHMGIFRNYNYFYLNMKPHLGLAMELHGFAASASKQAYPHIQYMVTNPADKMQELMKNEFPIGEQIWFGSAKGLSKNKCYNLE